MSPDLNNQHRSGIILAGLGTTTLLTGILLGNWISRRSLRTIAILSNTAAAIAETNLSQRIPTTGIDLEIQQLAETLNQAFDRLQAAFQRQSRFIADASHELRTPITVIIAQCELALLRSRAESEYRSALDASLRAAQRMHALAESLLTLAEAEASPLGEPAGLVATATAIAQVLEFLTPLSAERNLLVSTRLEDCSIVCRRTVFDRIILNALSNAVRHNIQNGTIQVLTNAKDSTIHIQISNTCNIPPDRNLAELGTPFFRVDPARATSTGGAGLGLAITKELIATLSGTIAFNPSPDNFEVEIILPRNPPSRA